MKSSCPHSSPHRQPSTALDPSARSPGPGLPGRPISRAGSRTRDKLGTKTCKGNQVGSQPAGPPYLPCATPDRLPPTSPCILGPKPIHRDHSRPLPRRDYSASQGLLRPRPTPSAATHKRASSASPSPIPSYLCVLPVISAASLACFWAQLGLASVTGGPSAALLHPMFSLPAVHSSCPPFTLAPTSSPVPRSTGLYPSVQGTSRPWASRSTSLQGLQRPFWLQIHLVFSHALLTSVFHCYIMTMYSVP